VGTNESSSGKEGMSAPILAGIMVTVNAPI